MRADGLLDGNRRIEPSRAIDVDVVDAEADERVPQEVLDRRRPRVDAKPAPVRRRAARRTSPTAAPPLGDPAARG